MIRLPNVILVWGQPEFEAVLKETLAKLGKEFPLQAGLTSGSFALEEPLEVMVISSKEQADAIVAKVGIFYQSLTPGCACAGDPTVESENTEHITVLVSVDKQTAEATVQLLDE